MKAIFARLIGICRLFFEVLGTHSVTSYSMYLPFPADQYLTDYKGLDNCRPSPLIRDICQPFSA